MPANTPYSRNAAIALDDLGVEFTAELVRLAGGDPRHDVVEVLAQELRQRAGQPLELLAADILDGDVKLRRTVHCRFDVDPHLDLEPEFPPGSVVIPPRQRAGDRGPVLAIDQAPDQKPPRSRVDRDEAAAMHLPAHFPRGLERQRGELLDQAGEVLAVELHLGGPGPGRFRRARRRSRRRRATNETRGDKAGSSTPALLKYPGPQVAPGGRSAGSIAPTRSFNYRRSLRVT